MCKDSYFIWITVLLLVFAGCSVIADSGRTIDFGTAVAGDSFTNIYTITPDGKGAKLIIEDGLYPRLSKDKTKIVYSTDPMSRRIFFSFLKSF